MRLPLPSLADIVPVLEGQAQPSTAQRLPYGCQQLAQQLESLLAARGTRLAGGSAAASAARPASAPPLEDLARSIVRVAGSAEDVAAAAAAPEPATHTLPDGQTITIQQEGLQLGEALMDASQLGLDVAPLSAAVHTAATAQGDKDTRKVRGREPRQAVRDPEPTSRAGRVTAAARTQLWARVLPARRV